MSEVGSAPTFLFMRTDSMLDRIRGVVERTVDAEGYELVELELKGGGDRRVLRVFIDKIEGISHRDCQLISEQVGTVLDVEDVVPFSYVLEVSSPGVDRKLVKESDYARFQDRLAKIHTRVALNDQKVFKGRLRGFHEGKVQIELTKGLLLEIPMEVIQEARLEFEWPSRK